MTGFVEFNGASGFAVPINGRSEAVISQARGAVFSCSLPPSILNIVEKPGKIQGKWGTVWHGGASGGSRGRIGRDVPASSTATGGAKRRGVGVGPSGRGAG